MTAERRVTLIALAIALACASLVLWWQFVGATGLPVSLKDCATRKYPLVLYSGDTLSPGVATDTYTVEQGAPIVLTVLMGMDDSSGAGDPCNCDTIIARWDSSNCNNWFYKFRVALYREQPEPPNWTRQTELDSIHNIDTVAALGNGGTVNPGDCTDLITCPWTFVLPATSFTRTGLGHLMVRGRVRNYNNDYLAPAGDTCKVYFNVVHTPADSGTRVMVAP